MESVGTRGGVGLLVDCPGVGGRGSAKLSRFLSSGGFGCTCGGSGCWTLMSRSVPPSSAAVLPRPGALPLVILSGADANTGTSSGLAETTLIRRSKMIKMSSPCFVWKVNSPSPRGALRPQMNPNAFLSPQYFRREE